jgi:hypothetical protein
VEKKEMKEKNDIIYDFGKDVIVKARDMTIKDGVEILGGISKAPPHIKLYNELENLDERQKDAVKKIIINSVDSAINNFLWMMEENNDKYAFTAKCENGGQFDIEQESDGLCVGQYVFIGEFSEYNNILEILETGEIEKKSKSE